jgi:hypothetical protein
MSRLGLGFLRTDFASMGAWALTGTLLMAAGCGGGGARTEGGTAANSGGGAGGASACSGGAPAGWPTVLVARGGTDPALFAGPDDSAPAFGYLSEGVRLRVDCPPSNGRVAVTVGGSLVVHGWVPISRTMVYAAQRGRIDGTPVFLGENDPIGLMSAESNGTFRVDLRPRLGREGAGDLGPFSGTVSADLLRDRASFEGVDPGLTAGEAMLLPAGMAVQVFDRPNGSVITTLPVLDPPLTVVVLRARDGWSGVRIGVGPYLVGYIEGTLEASTMEAVGTRPTAPDNAVAEGEMPGRIAREDDGTLVRIAAGTEIFFYGEDVGRARGAAWGREFSRDGDDVDVYLAVDDGVALRGIVPADAVSPVREGEDGAE